MAYGGTWTLVIFRNPPKWFEYIARVRTHELVGRRDICTPREQITWATFLPWFMTWSDEIYWKVKPGKKKIELSLMWQESKCQGSVLLREGFTHYLQIFVKYGKVCWNFSDFVIDGSRIMTSSQGKKVVWTLRRNLGPDWVAWHRVSLKSGILGTGCWLSTDLQSRRCGSLPWKCGSESQNLPWRHRVSLTHT